MYIEKNKIYGEPSISKL